jgi:membrane protease YdiL (CAAX protease family)
VGHGGGAAPRTLQVRIPHDKDGDGKDGRVNASSTGVPEWEYRLDHWPDDARRALDARLTRSLIPHEWRATSVFVPRTWREQVDLLLGSLSVTGASPQVVGHLAPSVPPTPAPGPPPGWYPDPWAQSPARWWDGREWTGYVATAPPAERSWIPPRGSHEGAMRGGLIAIAGVVGAVVLSVLGALAVLPFGGSLHSLEALCLSQAGLWLALFVACRVAVVRHGSGSLRDLGLVRLSWRQVGLGSLVGVITRFVAGALAVAIAELFPGDQWKNTAAPGTTIDRNALSITVIVLILVVGAPFFEELFFRGLVQGAFTSRIGARAAMFAQAACFGLVHYRAGMNLAQFTITIVTIAVVGGVLGSLRWHAEKLGPGMVAHGVFNAIAALVLFTL